MSDRVWRYVRPVRDACYGLAGILVAFEVVRAWWLR